MKYRRKPVVIDAIQWTGDNQIEVADFLYKATCAYATYDDGLGNLIILNGRDLKAIVPKFGWVVRDGKTLQFYRDTTFWKTFEEVPYEEHKEIADAILKDAEDRFNAKLEGKDVPFVDNLYKAVSDNPSILDSDCSDEHKQSASTIYDNINPYDSMEKYINDVYKSFTKTRVEVKKRLSDVLKDMKESDKTKGTEIDTFESVLDEMKELHAKKNKDYGDSFHKSFVEFGPTAGIVRLNDKMERAKSLVKNGKAEVRDESLLDSLEDLACYTVMLYVELKNKDNGKL